MNITLFNPQDYQGLRGQRKIDEPSCTVMKSGKLVLNEKAIELMGLKIEEVKMAIGIDDQKTILIAETKQEGFKMRPLQGKQKGLVCQAKNLVDHLKKILDLPFNPGQKKSVRYRVEKADNWFKLV